MHYIYICIMRDQCDHSLAFFTRSWLFVVHLGVLVFYRFSWRIGFLLSWLFRNLVNSWLFSLAHLGIYENEEWSHCRQDAVQKRSAHEAGRPRSGLVRLWRECGGAGWSENGLGPTLGSPPNLSPIRPGARRGQGSWKANKFSHV